MQSVHYWCNGEPQSQLWFQAQQEKKKWMKQQQEAERELWTQLLSLKKLVPWPTLKNLPTVKQDNQATSIKPKSWLDAMKNHKAQVTKWVQQYLYDIQHYPEPKQCEQSTVTTLETYKFKF